MGRAYKCDRCGGFYDCAMPKKYITVTKIDASSRVMNSEVDLCENCRNELYNWLHAFDTKEKTGKERMDKVIESMQNDPDFGVGNNS